MMMDRGRGHYILVMFCIPGEFWLLIFQRSNQWFLFIKQPTMLCMHHYCLYIISVSHNYGDVSCFAEVCVKCFFSFPSLFIAFFQNKLLTNTCLSLGSEIHESDFTAKCMKLATKVALMFHFGLFFKLETIFNVLSVKTTFWNVALWKENFTDLRVYFDKCSKPLHLTWIQIYKMNPCRQHYFCVSSLCPFRPSSCVIAH